MTSGILKAFYTHVITVPISVLLFSCTQNPAHKAVKQASAQTDTGRTELSSTQPHVAPDTSTIPHDATGEMIRYGRKLLIDFPYYLGQHGTVGKYGGNALGCQNCHLDAGTRPYGLNYFSSHARYPQYRAREGKILTLADRINNCVERPINGKPIPLNSKEMIAMLAYMKWLSQGIPVDTHVEGDELLPVKLGDVPASSDNGKMVYAAQCARCHGDNGQGQLKSDGVAYLYPPLWGLQSYQPGSSMHRIIKAAQFIKYNMPFDLAKWNNPVLSDQEALDVAAFINDDNIHQRPYVEPFSAYPVRTEKPVDYYTGPFADGFSEHQHKFGPYNEIIKYRQQHSMPTGY